MDTISRKKIRVLYYTSGIATMLAVSLVVAVPYFVSTYNNFKLLIDEIRETILTEKRRVLSNIVDRTINEIDAVRSLTRDECQSLGRAQARLLAGLGREAAGAALARETAREGGPGAGIPDPATFGVVAVDETGRATVLSAGNAAAASFAGLVEAGKTDFAGFPVVAAAKLGDRGALYVLMPEATLEGIAKARCKALIRSVLFDANRYVWINEIRNYDGGDDYAVRVVHPNLPETEGSGLSTNTRDIQGNLPYLEELEGVKAKGELYFEYYFKKMNSDDVTRKLAYAKLYKPFDWVVATGIHLDDVEHIITQRTSAFDKIYYGQVRNYSILIASGLGLCTIMLVVFESRINRMINSFVRKLRDSEAELREERDKLDKAYKQLHDVAYVDFLTGLLNRRAMYDRIKEEISRAHQDDFRFCLILSDVDQFKRINDTYGHDVGDAVLKAIAARLRENVRRQDDLARWGGEEFLILARAADLEQGLGLAETLRLAVARGAMAVDGGSIPATMTFGVVEYDAAKSYDALIREVDEYLYLGKQRDRNCVVSRRSV